MDEWIENRWIKLLFCTCSLLDAESCCFSATCSSKNTFCCWLLWEAASLHVFFWRGEILIYLESQSVPSSLFHWAFLASIFALLSDSRSSSQLNKDRVNPLSFSGGLLSASAPPPLSSSLISLPSSATESDLSSAGSSNKQRNDIKFVFFSTLFDAGCFRGNFKTLCRRLLWFILTVDGALDSVEDLLQLFSGQTHQLVLHTGLL